MSSDEESSDESQEERVSIVSEVDDPLYDISIPVGLPRTEQSFKPGDNLRYNLLQLLYASPEYARKYALIELRHQIASAITRSNASNNTHQDSARPTLWRDTTPSLAMFFVLEATLHAEVIHSPWSISVRFEKMRLELSSGLSPRSQLSPYAYFTETRARGLIRAGALDDWDEIGLHLWKFAPAIQGGGLGSLLLSYMTTVAMQQIGCAALRIHTCFLPTFLVADGRYGFVEQSAYFLSPSANGSPLLRYPPRLGGSSGLGTHAAPDIAWASPALRAMHRFFTLHKVDALQAPRKGADGKLHPMWIQLRVAEAILARVSLPGATANSINSENDGWLGPFNLRAFTEAEKKAFIIESVMKVPPQVGQAPHERNPFAGFTIRLCTPAQVEMTGCLPTYNDVTAMQDGAFWKPLERVAPVRGLFPDAMHFILVVSDVRLQEPLGGTERSNFLRILITFFVEVARELGYPVLFDMRAETGTSIATAADFDLGPGGPSSIAWDHTLMGNGPVPFIAASAVVKDTYWHYPQTKPKTFAVPPAYASLPREEVATLPDDFYKAFNVPMVARESMPAALARLAAVSEPVVERKSKRARYVALACTNCAHPQAQFMTADGAHAFCGAQCQRRFEDNSQFE